MVAHLVEIHIVTHKQIITHNAEKRSQFRYAVSVVNPTGAVEVPMARLLASKYRGRRSTEQDRCTGQTR